MSPFYLGPSGKANQASFGMPLAKLSPVAEILLQAPKLERI